MLIVTDVHLIPHETQQKMITSTNIPARYQRSWYASTFFLFF